jgi:hypothetical protein
MAVETYDGKCECMNGYVWGENIVGEPECISGSRACKDQYGYNSRYDSFSGQCECRSGYAFEENSIGQKECTSLNSICSDRLGYGGDYDSISDSCTCRSGYELSKTHGDGYTCERCSTKYGINSSYNYLNEKCECDDGYTLKDGKCEKKQNNVYFYLHDLDTVKEEALVESLHTEEKYIIEYSYGCYDWSFEDYEGELIVINLGTDYDLDTWDTVVLQEDNETCDISNVENTNQYTLNNDQPVISSSPISSPPVNNTTNTSATTNVFESNNPPNQTNEVRTVRKKFEFKDSLYTEVDQNKTYKVKNKANVRNCPDINLCNVIDTYEENREVDVLGYYNDNSWAQIGYENKEEIGWIYYPLLREIPDEILLDVESNQGSTTKSEINHDERVDNKSGWLKNLFTWVTILF